MPNLTQQGSNNSGFYEDILQIFLSNVIYFALHLFPFGMLPHKATLGLAFSSLENNQWFILLKKSQISLWYFQHLAKYSGQQCLFSKLFGVNCRRASSIFSYSINSMHPQDVQSQYTPPLNAWSEFTLPTLFLLFDSHKFSSICGYLPLHRISLAGSFFLASSPEGFSNLVVFTV